MNIVYLDEIADIDEGTWAEAEKGAKAQMSACTVKHAGECRSGAIGGGNSCPKSRVDHCYCSMRQVESTHVEGAVYRFICCWCGDERPADQATDFVPVHGPHKAREAENAM